MGGGGGASMNSSAGLMMDGGAFMSGGAVPLCVVALYQNPLEYIFGPLSSYDLTYRNRDHYTQINP